MLRLFVLVKSVTHLLKQWWFSILNEKEQNRRILNRLNELNQGFVIAKSAGSETQRMEVTIGQVNVEVTSDKSGVVSTKENSARKIQNFTTSLK